MRIKRHFACVAVAFWLASVSSIFAARNALIVIGSTGSASIGADLSEVAQNIRKGLVQRGFAPDSIEILGAPPSATLTRDQILASLKKRGTLIGTDEFWLVLLGFSAPGAEGAPAFQVRGPRLAVTDLKPALDAIAARQFIFIGTSDSGAFVPALLQANRSVLSATAGQGEIDLPRFPECWAAALVENPQAGWKEIAARAAALTDQAYATNSLAQGEHSRLGDPATGTVLEPPFGVDTTAQPEPKAGGGNSSMALIGADDIKVEIRKPNAEWEKQPATPETRQLLEAARATPNPAGYNAILLEQRLGYKVGDDRSAEDFVMQRIYIEREDGVERWANYRLPQDPPAITTKLVAARIIQPDGSSTVFNPAKMPSATDCSSGLCGAVTMVFMPDTHAGCLVEIAYRTRHLLDTGLPDFSEELPVQLDVPVLKTDLQLQVPPSNKVHYKLRNSGAKPVETTVDGMRTLTWSLQDLAAFEPLPFDPPVRDTLVALDISSLDSWDAFAVWTRRLLQGSDLQDASVKAKAAELAAGATTRVEKIRKTYEFVSALRYVAIEFGVNGIRPRTPAVVLQNRYGDCKDKANLLIALLSDMGVDARFSVLNRGSSTDVDFPSWQFNHAIAYVPKAPASGQPEDLWLDTTDSTAPFPTLSPGDIGRDALVFEKDSVHFLTIAAPGKNVTDVQEDWHLEQRTDGAWSGTLRDSWSGLAEYEVRASVRGHSPRQRDFVLQTELAKLLPDADFTKLDLTPADDLSIPLRLTAQVASPSAPHPLCGMDLAAYFAPPERNRPLLINNGQKLQLTQTVELVYAGNDPAQDPAAFERQLAGIHAAIAWKRTGDRAWTRTAKLTIDQPLVAQADYAGVRGMLRDWSDLLAR